MMGTLNGVVCGNCSTREQTVRHATADDVRLCYSRKYGRQSDSPIDRAAQARARQVSVHERSRSTPSATMSAASGKLITDKQIQFVNDLVAGKFAAREVVRVALAQFKIEQLPELPRWAASSLIDALKELPKIDKSQLENVAPTNDLRSQVKSMMDRLPDVPTARYAIREIDFEKSPEPQWRFYKIDKPNAGRWAGYTFIKVLASDEEWPVKNLDRQKIVLEAILHDVEAAATNYGREVGQCSKCGRTLTVPESIERGIGPVCAKRMGL